MLLIWTKDPAARVMKAIGSKFKQYPDLQVEVCNNFAYLPDRSNLKAVLAMGAEPVTYLQNMKVLPKNRTISSLRNSAVHVEGLSAPVLVTYSSGIGDIDYGKYIDQLCDAQLAVRLHETGDLAPVIGKYAYASHFTELLADVRAQFKETGKPVDVALDLETVGFDPYREPAEDGSHPGGYIVTIQASSREGTGHTIYFESRAELAERLNADLEFVVQLHELLTSPMISLRGANLKFDLNWLWVHTGIQCENFKFDTTLVGSLLDENRSNSLNMHAKVYTTMGGYDDAFNASIDKGRMDLIDKDILLPYANGDSDATLRVANAQKKLLLSDPALTRFYINILHPAARAMEVVEQGGVFIDLTEYDKLEAELNEEIDTLTMKARKIMGGRIVAKHQDLSKRGGLNLTKASLLIDFMFSPMGLNLTPLMQTAKGSISTAMDHLEMFKNHPDASEFVNLLSDFSSATKTLGTYVHGFKSHIRSDGNFHPTYFLFAGGAGVGGTNTGRLSCKDPAFQCHSGSTPVFTEGGEQSILSVVEGYERGESFRVLTHTGAWRDVVGVYRNGVRPLLRITTSMGRAIDCTHNHPLLTPQGFVQAGRVVVGGELYGVESYEAAQRLIRPSGGILDGVEGLGCGVQGGEKEVPLQLQVRGREGSLGQCLGWPEPEQILWLLQESAAHNTWTQQEGQSVQDLLGMAAHDFSVLQPERQGVRELWGAWHHGLRFVERLLRGVLERYGREAYESVLGQARGGWAVLQRQLPVGHGVGAGEESPELRVAGVQRAAEARQRLGSGVWAESGDGAGQDYSRVERDSSPYHAAQAEAAGYLREVIVSIEELPAEETFDLTIDQCHSFVANGVVVHNTIPKHTKWAKRLRKVFIAPPGMLVMENDYSQGELRVIACIANEPTMLEVYRQGLDLHVITPSKFVGFTVEEILAMEETDPDKFGAIRQMGKAGNFGLIYGMSAGGFQAYASTSYGVHLSDAESNAFRNGFFETYPALPEYHKEYKAHARTHGYVRSPLGRIRHLPLINSKNGEVRSGAERQAINSPVQGCLSDMMIWAIAEGKAKGYHLDAPCFGLVHDAGYRYIPEDNFEFYAQREKDQMENLPFEKVGWNPQLKFVTDCKVGKNMAELSKVKLAS